MPMPGSERRKLRAAAAKGLALKLKNLESDLGMLPSSSETDILWQKLKRASFEASTLAVLLENDAEEP